jgi:signal peptidase I
LTVKRRWAYVLALLAAVVLAGCGGPVSSGDRVLVSKFFYDTGLKDPQRWDVVVFRYPKAPISNGTPKNYIKRLLGLPGELLAIFFGRIYRANPARVPAGYDKTRDPKVNPNDLWRVEYLESKTLNPAADDGFWKEHQFEILRKPLNTLLAMRRSVYDNDYPAADLKKVLPPRWAGVGPATRWTATDANGFRHPGQADGSLDWLRYRHIVRPDDWPARTDPGYAQKVKEIAQRTHKDYDLRLMFSLNEVRDIPTEDKNRIIVAGVKNVLYFRIFDSAGKMVMNTDEKQYPAEAGLINDLRKQLQKMRAPHELSPGEKRQIITAVTSITGHTPHKPQLITDFQGYNSAITDNPNRLQQELQYKASAHSWVGDLMLECTVKVERAEGELCLELSKGVDRFQASWNLQTGECTLYRLEGVGGARGKPLAKAETTVKAPGSYTLRFANVDERLAVWVDGNLPFATPQTPEGVFYDGPKQRGPTENDLEPASIGTKGAAVQVEHLKLWRDTYYTLKGTEPDATASDYSDPKEWAPLRKLEYRTMYVQPGHYLCLGDNSPQSADSREWGTVPERLMLGRALAVYFPFNRLGRIR